MHTQPWWHYWWDPIVLAQLQVVTGIVGGLLALLALVYAWRVARRQFKMMDDQGAIVARQSELMEEQAATSRRIEDITKRQGEIAEVQHTIMLEQLAKRPELLMAVRRIDPVAVVQTPMGDACTTKYLLSIWNLGTKSVQFTSWRIYLRADERLMINDLPPEFMAGQLEHPETGEPIYVGNGILQLPVLPGGITDLFEFTVWNRGTERVKPQASYYLRCEDGRFPEKDDENLSFEELGAPATPRQS